MTAKINYSTHGNELIVNSSNLSFPWPVAQVIHFDESIVVRLEPDVGSKFNENVYGVNLNGKIIWKIEPCRHVYEDSPYTHIAADGDIVKLSNWDGDELFVSPKTGTILKKTYNK